jgi:hypothetical protein
MRLTTTKALGFSLREARKDDLLHVFIAKSKDDLEHCFQNGWYPLVINDRVIAKPFVDVIRFGYNLGYPPCCVDFFRRYNDWYRYNYLYEVLKNTDSSGSHYLCNSLAKNTAYSYIYHMPCSYACVDTIALAKKIREGIAEEEPEFVRKIDLHLQLPFLVFFEKKIYAFEGRIIDGAVRYRQVFFLGLMPEYDAYGEALKQGDCVRISGNTVQIFKKGRLIRKCAEARKQFAPEMPFMIQFKDSL